MPDVVPGHNFSLSRNLKKQVHVSRMKAHISTQGGPIFVWNSAIKLMRSGSSKHAKPGKNESNDSFNGCLKSRDSKIVICDL